MKNLLLTMHVCAALLLSGCAGVILVGAGVGAGAWPDVPSACDQLLQITGSTSPQRTDVYQQLYPYYQGLYAALAPIFHGIAD